MKYIGGQIPGARIGTIEIRPAIELAGLPKKLYGLNVRNLNS